MAGASIVIGIDGGATHATAVVCDTAGEELARVAGGPGIINPLDPTGCVGRLASLARSALAQAGLFAPADAMCCALAGAGRTDVSGAVRAELLREYIARKVDIITDAEAALADAFGDAPGMLLIAGTGSVAWGRGEDGRVERCGGWGTLLGDEGSGYALGLGALRASVQAADGRVAPTALSSLVSEHAHASDPEELIRWTAAASKAEIAALAPGVLALAAHDAVAAALRDEAARALVQHVVVLHERLAPWHAAPMLALAGGLIREGGPLRSALTEAVLDVLPDIRLHDRRVDAARGAARLARAMQHA